MFIDKISYERLNYITNFLAPFRWRIWLCMVFSLVLYSAYISLVKKYYRRGLIGEFLRIIDAYAVIFNQTFRLPIKSAFRFIVIIWILSTMITNIYYQSEFKSYIIVTKEKKLETFSDIMHANRELGGPSFIRDFLEDYDNDTVMHVLYKR